MEIIPALDIIDGKCVRLSKGDFGNKTIYNDDPLEVAKSFEDAGIKRLHIVDLDGAGGKSLSNLRVLELIAKSSTFIIDYGGGLKKTSDIESAFIAGASMVSTGSVAVKNPGLFSEWLKNFGAEKFLPGADVLDGRIRIHGWKEESGIGLFDFIRSLTEKGIEQIFCTDISKDGMMQGPSVELYKEILLRFPALHLIASGGVSCYENLVRLKEAGCRGAIVGKAFYEGKISLKQMAEFSKLNSADD